MENVLAIALFFFVCAFGGTLLFIIFALIGFDIPIRKNTYKIKGKTKPRL